MENELFECWKETYILVRETCNHIVPNQEDNMIKLYITMSGMPELCRITMHYSENYIQVYFVDYNDIDKSCYLNGDTVEKYLGALDKLYNSLLSDKTRFINNTIASELNNVINTLYLMDFHRGE